MKKINQSLFKKNKIAIIYQSFPTPTIYGVRKPMKLNGYIDGSADIAYVLKQKGFNVVLPTDDPNPAIDNHWAFPDNERSLQDLLHKKVNFIWPNTVLYPQHPIYSDTFSAINFMGKNYPQFHNFDDKIQMYQFMSSNSLVTPNYLVSKSYKGPVAKSKMIDLEISTCLLRTLSNKKMHFPLVVKPIRGRGSEGIQLVSTIQELSRAVKKITQKRFDFFGKTYQRFGNSCLIEEYLPGDEITITILPPGYYKLNGSYKEKLEYWALPVLKRDGHQNGILPSINSLPPTANTTYIKNFSSNYHQFLSDCILLAKKMKCYSLLRIDGREDKNGKYQMFDVNIKPAITGGNRFSDNTKKSVVALSAELIGLNYSDLIENLLDNFQRQQKIRKVINYENCNRIR